MTILTVSSLGLSYGVDVILEGISFAMNEGDRVGIVGKNGAGKTTLLRLLRGEEAPTEGSFTYARGTTVACLEQNACAAAEPGCTVTDYMLRGIPAVLTLEAELAATERELESADTAGERRALLASRLAEQNERFDAIGGRTYRARCDALLARTGFSDAEKELPVSELSGGQKTRLALSRILFTEPDVLMLDEPTNHLDIDTLTWLESYLAQYKKTLLVVSHDRYFLDRVTNKTLYMEGRRAKLYPGNYSKTEELRDAERAFEEKRWKLQQKEIARIQAFIAQQRQFGRERNFITIASREKALARMERYERPTTDNRTMNLSFKTAERGGNDVLTVRGLSMSFDGKDLFRDVDLDVKRGERLFLVGQNGVGKSTLMRILCGKLLPKSGTVLPGAAITCGYYDQENHGISNANTVFSELQNAYPTKTDGELRTLLGAFLFRGEDVYKSVASLSGGERCRLALCKMMWSGANLLLLDEPTNHLDIQSKEALEQALEDYEGTVIAVSHDRYFIDKLATRIVELCPASVGGVLSFPLSADDGYDSFREFRKQNLDRLLPHVAETPTVSAGKQDYLRRKEEAANKRREEKRKRDREARVAELEGLLPTLEKELYAPDTPYTRAAELTDEIARLEEELLQLYGEE